MLLQLKESQKPLLWHFKVIGLSLHPSESQFTSYLTGLWYGCSGKHVDLWDHWRICNLSVKIFLSGNLSWVKGEILELYF